MKIFIKLNIVLLFALAVVVSAQVKNYCNTLLIKNNQNQLKEIFSSKMNPLLSNNESMLDSAIVTKEDGTIEKHSYTYTSESFGNWATYLLQNIDGNEATNFLFMIYNYNNEGKFQNSIGQIWNGSDWVNFLRYTNFYNAEFLTGSKEDMWDGSNWITTGESSITYDSANTTEIEISESNFQGFVFKTRETTKYDADDNKLSIMIEEHNSIEWEKISLTAFEYNSDRYKIFEQSYIWGDNNDWENEFTVEYSYDANNNITEELTKFWDGSSWSNGSKISLTFDSNNYMTENLGSVWNGTAWDNTKRFSYEFTSDGNLFHGLSEIWDSENWVSSEDEFHFFDTKGWYTEYETHGQSYLFDGIEVTAYYNSYITETEKEDLEISSFTLAQNYPNPFNPVTNISFKISNSSHINLTVFDLLGNKITELVDQNLPSGKHYVKLNGENLASGFYLYRLTAGDQVKTKKMLLLK
ncbi:MAG: T9SS type A sorting domain-containing protein [Melioribacteraceae bacterium]|nr:T9SS type A sorting domain-containing protein [Melioribacteraceae bacterium]